MSTPVAAHVAATAPVGFGAKLNLLWATNKPLFVGIIALLTLIIFAIIFCIVYFLVIKPHNDQAAHTTTQPTTTQTAGSTTPKAAHDLANVVMTAHKMFQNLRNYQHA